MSYVGLDGSESFVALARQRAAGLRHVAASFVCADIARLDWLDRLPGGAFDCVLTLAVLHHIPGKAARQRLVQQMAACLGDRGSFIASTWQFMSSERLRKKVTPWATAGLDDSQLDAGDYLLDWERGGHGLRYCHLIGEEELRTLCTGAGLTVAEMFVADQGLNLFVVARK
jgi:SAM-dependent methyltransferase